MKNDFAKVLLQARVEIEDCAYAELHNQSYAQVRVDARIALKEQIMEPVYEIYQTMVEEEITASRGLRKKSSL